MKFETECIFRYDAKECEPRTAPHQAMGLLGNANWHCGGIPVVFKMEELNWKELDAFDRNQSVVFIPISPLEEHGPHLPVGVDFFHAASFASDVARDFSAERPDWNIVITPPLAV